jgi:hypothetical protein
MFLDFMFTGIFIFAIYYLIRYQLNLKKAAENSQKALYPKTADEFASVLIPAEWKAMEPLTKDTKTYRYVHWGSVMALVLLTILLGIVLFTDWLGSSFFSIAYFFFAIINVIPHRGNLYLFQDGMILNGRYYATKQIGSYKIEEIVRWHELYGLDDRVNYGYKLTFRVKNIRFIQPNFVVITERDQLDKIVDLLKKQGIYGEITPVNSEGRIGEEARKG